jgi:vancomycin permeability regulator SanA
MRVTPSLRTLPSSLVHAFVGALALFGAANALSGLLGGADRNSLWIADQGIASPIVGICSFVLLALGLGRGATWPWTRRLHALACGLLALLCARDAWTYQLLRSSGALVVGSWCSLSLLLAVLWSLAAWIGPPPPPRTPVRRLGRAVLGMGAGCALLLAHLVTFGATDYTRPASAAVVLGAKVHADGRPSGALLDRTRTACALYRAGHVRHLVLSGGRDPAAPLSEAACMERIALDEGLPREALILDEHGVTSDATLRTVADLARDRGWSEVLLVSHDVHLARLALLAQVHGLRARTVPADESVAWRSKPLFVLRELLAFGWHLLRTSV